PLGISFPVGPVDVFRFDVQADFPVYAFGRHLNSHRAAKLDHRRAEADRDATESDVAAEVTAAAFDLLETIAQIDVARSNEEALQRTVADATAQQDAGRVTRAAVLEAQVEHAAARRRRERLESLVRIRRIVLNALLGRPTDDATVLIDDRVTRPPSFDEQALLAEALRNRPEVRSAELAVRRSRRTLESVVGSELPELRGSVGYHTDDNEFIDQSDFGFFELTLTLPIFRAGARRARIRRARREVDLAGLRLADTVAEVRTDVAASYRDVVETYADIGVARQSVERSAESLRIQREKFGAGRATSREVLDSTALLNQARFAEVQAIYDYKEALQRLHRARGADPRRPPRASDGPK
ncbi:MAG: TolC family protein, partial [Planctomycetota bacterium]